MKVKKYKRGLAVMLGLALAVQLPGSVPFQMLDSYAYTGAATVKASSLNVRSGAGTGYQAVGRLAAGASIQILGEQTGTDGNTWYQIRFSGTGGAQQTGYVSAAYIRLPVSYTTDAAFEAKLSSEGFPESYKDGLRQLHAQYPNWIFKAKKRGLTGAPSLKMRLFWEEIWCRPAVFPPGNPLKAAPITGITVPGPALTAATGSQRQRILYATIWIPEISWMIPMFSSFFPMSITLVPRPERGCQRW